MKNYPKDAYLLLRLGLGINLLMHGLVRMGAHYAQFQQWISELFANSPLPPILVSFTGHLIPPVEFSLGLLLIIGLKTRAALLGASLLFINLIFGMCLIQKWEIVGVQMIYLIHSTLLLFLHEHNEYSLDSRMQKAKQ